MNEEIKECIEALLTVACCPEHDESCRKVYYYITNLQENERLNRFKYNIPNDKTKTVPTITKSYKNEYENYKSRCEKALKKLGEIRQSTFTKYNSNEWKNCLSYNDDIEPLKNILQGSDEK